MACIATQIDDLEREISRKRQRLKDLQQRQKNVARTNDTRRKVIYGAALLAGLKNRTPEERDRTLERVHRFITNNKDREFLGLQPLPESKGYK